jgi:hypothetical protein
MSSDRRVVAARPSRSAVTRLRQYSRVPAQPQAWADPPLPRAAAAVPRDLAPPGHCRRRRESPFLGRNACTLSVLAKECESWQGCHNLHTCVPNKQQQKIRTGSTRWLAPAEFLEFAVPGDLKANQACSPRGASRGDLRGGASCGACARSHTLRSRAASDPARPANDDRTARSLAIGVAMAQAVAGCRNAARS